MDERGVFVALCYAMVVAVAAGFRGTRLLYFSVAALAFALAFGVFVNG